VASGQFPLSLRERVGVRGSHANVNDAILVFQKSQSRNPETTKTRKKMKKNGEKFLATSPFTVSRVGATFINTPLPLSGFRLFGVS
jgi:hypothetical protein